MHHRPLWRYIQRALDGHLTGTSATHGLAISAAPRATDQAAVIATARSHDAHPGLPPANCAQSGRWSSKDFGNVAERSNAPDCKSGTTKHAGSNPAVPTSFMACSSEAEQSAVNRPVVGSTPTVPAISAGIAQLAERLTCNQGVAGSMPVAGST